MVPPHSFQSVEDNLFQDLGMRLVLGINLGRYELDRERIRLQVPQKALEIGLSLLRFRHVLRYNSMVAQLSPQKRYEEAVPFLVVTSLAHAEEMVRQQRRIGMTLR
jgi:hypothetical protein